MLELLDYHLQLMNLKRHHDGKSLLATETPSKNLVILVGQELAKTLRETADRLDARSATISFKGQTGKCPLCGDEKKHLKAHLMSSIHKWSEHQYNSWKATKRQPTQPKRNPLILQCRYTLEDDSQCKWQGPRLDTHLRDHHQKKFIADNTFKLYIKQFN